MGGMTAIGSESLERTIKVLVLFPTGTTNIVLSSQPSRLQCEYLRTWVTDRVRRVNDCHLSIHG